MTFKSELETYGLFYLREGFKDTYNIKMCRESGLQEVTDIASSNAALKHINSSKFL